MEIKVRRDERQVKVSKRKFQNQPTKNMEV